MSIGNSQVGSPVRLTASGVVAGGTAMARTYPGGGSTQAENTSIEGTILGFFVASASNTPTIALATNNAGAAGTTILNTLTPSAATYYPFPCTSPGGIFCTIGGTVDVTFLVVK